MTSGDIRVRKLTARSAILSALLGAHPAQASAAGILMVTSGLGFKDSAVRVALTRLVAMGDLDRSEGMYRLSARLIDRQRRQDHAIRPESTPWDGSWRLAVVTIGAEDSTDRAALRAALREAKFGELREGVWGRPNNIEAVVRTESTSRITLFTAVPDGDSVQLVQSAFAPREWASIAVDLIMKFDAAAEVLDRFEVAAALVRHILDDPLLPMEVLPAPWPGDAIRTTYESFRKELTDMVSQFGASSQ